MRGGRSEFIDINDLRYHVRRWGSNDAPPVFLLHGWMDVSASFEFLATCLGGDWNLIAPDWRGFGRSQWLHRPYWFPDYLVDLDALLSHYCRQQPARILGHSMGGIIACLYAGIRPQRVGKLITAEGFGVAATSPEMAPGRLEKWLQEASVLPPMHRYPDRQRFAERLRRDNPRLSPDRAAFLAEHLAHATSDGEFVWAGDPFHRTVNPVLYRLEEAKACWRRIAAPVLWLTGGDSDFVDRFIPDVADLAARKDCFASLAEIEIADAGHMLHHDQPQAIARLVEDFLGSD